MVEDKKSKQMITKGAIEEMLGACSLPNSKEKSSPSRNSLKASFYRKQMNSIRGASRVLGIAHKNHPSKGAAFSVEDEKDMVLIGYLAFLDPPKESAAEAIANLVGNGVHVKILTGDNDAVTRHICRKVAWRAALSFWA